MGKVENANRRVQDQIRVMIARIEERLKVEINVDSLCLPWLVRHAAWILFHYDKNKSGRTTYQEIRGKPYQGSIVEFGESVWFKSPGQAQDKLESRWLSGTWIGKIEKSDEHMVAVEKEVHKVRSIKRKVLGERWNPEEFGKVTATP